MSKIRTIYLLLFVVGILSSYQAKSQAEVVVDKDVIFYDGEGGVFYSESSKTTFTPSGNILKTASFQLPEDHFLVPGKGKYYIITRIKEIDLLGNQVTMYDVNVAIDKSGKFTINYHSNSAGTIFPRKYKW